MSDSVRPHKQQPIRLSRPWDSPSKNTGVGCHFLLQCRKVKSESEVVQLCLTLRGPMDCSLPGSSIYGICQARVLEWVAIAFSAKIILTQSYLADLKKTLLRKIIMADPGYGENCEHESEGSRDKVGRTSGMRKASLVSGKLGPPSPGPPDSPLRAGFWFSEQLRGPLH